MFTQPKTQLARWQDFTVRSEADIVFELAHQKGWKDCEIFGHGVMLTEPLESTGWKLIPADQYEYSIPAEGVDRVLQILNAGVRVQGVIVADDQKRKEPAPAPASAPIPAPAAPAHASPKILLPSKETVLANIGYGLLALIMIAGVVMMAAVAIFLAPILLLGAITTNGMGVDTDYDPKLVILVDDGNGGTAWVSVLTWYD